MKTKCILLFALCGIYTLLPAQNKTKQKNKKAKVETIIWHKYDISEATTDISARFPVIYKEKVQNDKLGRTHIISANDTASHSYYALHYTVHKAPLARIEAKELTQMTFAAFVGNFDKAEEIEAVDFKDKELEGLQTEFVNKKMAYKYRTFMYGNIQFQAILAHPYNVNQNEIYQTFFDSIIVKE